MCKNLEKYHVLISDYLSSIMEKRLEEKINEKIGEIITNMDEINQIITSMSSLGDDNKSFRYGLILGRLYNSFYYQTRRMLKRDPTKQEFTEFIKILQQRKQEILSNL